MNSARSPRRGGRRGDLANRRTGAALANGATSLFEFDINDRLTRIRHAKDAAGLFEVSYGYDALGDRRYTRDMVAADSSGLRTYDARFAWLHANPFAFTGQRCDAAVGTYHFLCRTYLPWLGRWGHRDPWGYADSTSLYEYTRSAPLFWVDPLGLWSWSGAWQVCVSTASGAGTGAAAGAGVGAGVGAAAGGIAGAGVGAGPGALAGAGAGAIAGAVGGAISGFLNGLLGVNAGDINSTGDAAKTGAISGLISGAASAVAPGAGAAIEGGLSAAGGYVLGGTAGAAGGAIAGGVSSGGDPRAIAGGAVAGGFAGYLGGSGDPLVGGVGAGIGESGGWDVGWWLSHP